MKEQELTRALGGIAATEEQKQRICKKVLQNQTQKESGYMSKKKIGILCFAATLILGITVFAASGLVASRISSSSSKPSYTTLPSAEQCVKDVGYTPVLQNAFENGYAFQSATISDNENQDETGKTVEKFKSIEFEYQKGKDRVMLFTNHSASDFESEGDVIATENGVELRYVHYTNKSVPADYTMTEEDKQAEKSGELVFSYGSSKVCTSEVQSVSWQQDGTKYQLMQIDGALQKEQLAEMAKELLAK